MEQVAAAEAVESAGTCGFDGKMLWLAWRQRSRKHAMIWGANTSIPLQRFLVPGLISAYAE